MRTFTALSLWLTLRKLETKKLLTEYYFELFYINLLSMNGRFLYLDRGIKREMV
jgi:hypothetical protein